MKNNGNFIKKHHKNNNFTILDNNIFMNKNLSLKAKGLLSMLLSLPDNWQFSERGLTALSKDGRDSLRSGLDELEEHGYLDRVSSRNEKGQFINTVYNVYELPTSGKPTSGNPTSDNPTAYKGLNNKELTDKGLNNKDYGDLAKSNPNDKYDKVPYFNEFWELYPNKKGKGQAVKTFQKQVKNKETFDLIVKDLERRKGYEGWTKEGGRFIQHPSTYLNQEMWLDEYEVKKIKEPIKLKIKTY